MESFGKMEPASSFGMSVPKAGDKVTPVLYAEGMETPDTVSRDLFYRPLMFTALPVFVENFSDYRPSLRHELPPLPPDEVVLNLGSEIEDPYFSA